VSDGDRGSADRERLFLGRSELAGLMQQFDWGSTSIGPPERWPQSLKTAVRIMLTSQQPIWIGWGDELICLYNDPCKSIIGGKHPRALGRPTSEVWSEIWQGIAPLLAKAMGGDEGTYFEAQLLIRERNGFPEETYYTFSYSPIPADDGSARGVFCANTDDTERVISERQLSLLRELASGTAESRGVKEACEHSAKALLTDPLDLPFAMIYMIEPGSEVAQLRALSGIEAEHPAVEPTLSLDGGGPWPLAEVLRQHRRCLVSNLSEVFSFDFPKGGWRQPPSQAVVLPILSGSEAGRSGFVIAGLNPFRRYDARYVCFLDLVAAQIAAAVNNGDAYEQKPFSERELFARVRATIDMAAPRREAVGVENAPRLEAETAQLRAEAILASIHDGFLALDDKWRFTYVNAAAEGLLGRSAQGLLGKNHWDEYPEAKGTALETNYRRAMDDRVGTDFEEFYPAWNRWFEIGVYPADSAGVSVYFQDITKRKRAEAALRELNDRLEAQVSERTEELQAKEARLRTIFATSYTFQGFLAIDGTVLDANATSLSGIGATLADVIGKPFWQTPWFTGTPGMQEAIRSAICSAAGGETVHREIHLNLPVGGWRWFDFQMRPVRNERGGGVAIVPEAVEVTERRKAEEAFRQAQKMEAIGQLTGGVAHDFNNLLTVIRSSADLLRRRDLPAERMRRYVDAISETADRAAKLTRQLLTFARRQALNRQVFDVAEQLEQVADILKTVLGFRTSFELRIAERPLLVEADANQFETALVNLVANSRDAMDGKGALTIRITKSRGANSEPDESAAKQLVAVSVSDTGCGIASDQIDRIFEPFYTTKAVGRGTGLGLSQVYGFAQQAGGMVRVDSEVGVGTTITLHLPLTSKPVQSTQPDALPSGEAKERWRILVVEDNQQVGEFSTQLLHDLGYQTVLARDAEQALKLLDEDPEGFDIVLSDVAMPGLDGVSLGKEIRRRLPGLPFVLNSGYSHILADDEGHGFDLLQKPYSVEELSRVLRRAMANRDLRVICPSGQ
jgi:PAS domain S-box-containing protein